MTNANAAALLLLTTYSEIEERLEDRTVEAVFCDRQGEVDPRGNYVRIEGVPHPSGRFPASPHVRRVAPSGAVFTDAALRRQLGIGCVSGEGLHLLRRGGA